MSTRKGISPLIASVLLIAFTMSVATLAGPWMVDLISGLQGDTGENTQRLVECSSVRLGLASYNIHQSTNELQISIQNLGNTHVEEVAINAFARDGEIYTTNISGLGEKEISSNSIPLNHYQFIDKLRIASTECPFETTEDIKHSYSWFTADANYRRTGYIPQEGVKSNPEILWNYTAENNIDYQDPVVADNKVFVSDNGGAFSDGNLRAINFQGEEVWYENLDTSVWAAATVTNSNAYVGDWDPTNPPTVYSVDVNSGERNWKSSDEGGRVWSAPIVEEDTLIVGDNSYGIHELDKEDGTINWQVKTGGQGLSDPAMYEDTIYTVGGERFLALDRHTGDVRWNVSHADFYVEGGYGSPASRSRPAVSDSYVYMGAENETYAMNRSDGSKEWEFSMPKRARGGISYHEGIVYSADVDTVYALDAETGSKLWDFDISNEFSLANIAVTDDSIFFADNQGQTYALDHEGNEKWELNVTNSAITTGPSVHNGRVYVASSDNNLYAIS